MAKPIQELFVELPRAFDKAEADRAAVDAANTDYQKKHDAAKAAFDKTVNAAAAALQKAQETAAESDAYLATIQAEFNALMGNRSNSRITASK